VLRNYPWRVEQAQELHRALIDLQVVHDSGRLQNLIEALLPEAAGRADETMSEIRSGLRAVELPAQHNLTGSEYGEALSRLRLAWLRGYLAR
jgi:hypothetical protein